MGMENKNYDVDALLRKALKSSEKPDEALIRKLKNDLNKERYSMKNKRAMRFSVAVAAALIVTLSLSFVAFGDPVWRRLQTRVVEGEQYISEVIVKVSDDGIIMGGIVPGEDGGSGRVVVEVDGELQVWRDPLILTDLDEALGLFRGEETPMLPTYLPEGFVFESAKFFVCPISNPEVEHAGTQLFLTFGDGEQDFSLVITNNPEEWGIAVWGAVEEITINGRDALVGSGGLSVQATAYTKYHFSINMLSGGSDLDYDTLIRMAESLQ